MEQAPVSIVKAVTPSLDRVPAEYRTELEAMEAVSDSQLRKIAAAPLSAAHQRQIVRLLAKNQRGRLSGDEQLRLDRLRREADRLTLRRAYAHLLLKYRGHAIPALSEINP